MARWIPCARPRAQLTPIDAAEVTEDDGRVTMLYRTDHNVRFIRITEPNGFTFWMMEVRS